MVQLKVKGNIHIHQRFFIATLGQAQANTCLLPKPGWFLNLELRKVGRIKKTVPQSRDR